MWYYCSYIKLGDIKVTLAWVFGWNILVLVSFNSNTTGVTSGVETAYSSEHQCFPPSLRCVRVIPAQTLVFCIVLCRLLFVHFRLVIVLSVLFSLGHCIVGPIFAWSLYCLSYFRLVIVLSVLFSLGHCIVCPIFAWSLYCLSYFRLDIVLSVLFRYSWWLPFVIFKFVSV